MCSAYSACTAFLYILLGSLSEWLSDHPVMVPAVLCVVLPALSDSDLSVPAVTTLKRICRECRRHLYPHANDILASAQVDNKTVTLFYSASVRCLIPASRLYLRIIIISVV